MENILNLVVHYSPFLIVISIVVFVHEFGHYWVARRCGIKVETFSIGFGHEIFGWTDKHGTRWKVSWLPLGGYVKMYGDAGAASTPDASVHTMTEAEKKVSFFHQPVNKRMAVIVAGPASNYLFAILVLALLFMIHGEPYTPAFVNDVVADGAAARAGIQPGDLILKIDDQDIYRFEDVKRIITLNTGTPVTIEVARNNAHRTLSMTPAIVTMKDNFGGEHKIGQIGIKSNELEYVKQPPVKAVKEAFSETWNLTAATLKAIGQMIIGMRGTEEIGGPIRIAQMFSDTFQEGWSTFVWRIGVISINLGLINLFPVPMLDGGHLAFYLAERFRGRPLSERLQNIGLNIGAVLVVTLMLFATWNDLVQLKFISYLRSLFS